MKLLKEIHEDNIQLIEEGTDGKKHFYIEGVFMQSNIKNKNGRIYPKDILAQETARYMKECVDQKRAYGELGHPDTPNINLDRVSHRIVSLTEDRDNFIGKALISENPMGLIVRTLMKEGGRIGVSSRALGSLKEVNGTNMVQDDLRLITAADIVADPSAPDAFVQGVYEQAEWVFVPNNKVYEKTLDKSRQKLIKTAANRLDETAVEIFRNLMNAL